MKWILFFVVFSFEVFAQEKVEAIVPTETAIETPIEKTAEPKAVVEDKSPKETKPALTTTEFYRENSRHSLMVGYEFISTWLPFKFTGGYTHIFNKKWSLEAEIGHGGFGTGAVGIDVASISENRYSLITRRYSGNSFHTIFGIYKNDFHAKLGSDLLDNMTDTSINDLRVEVIGLTLGFGNRWQWGNGFTLGVDWLRMNAPIFDRKVDDEILKNVTDNSDHNTIEDGLEKISKLPTFVLLGLYLGYTF